MSVLNVLGGNYDRILKLIKEEESEKIEFKSTLRTNLHTNQVDKKIENSVLKTIVAFLNSNGGVLLVGVEDSGKIVGVEKDNFQNNDKLNLHFTNLLKNRIGNQYLPLVDFILIKMEEGHVLRVDCRQSDKPVFLKMDGEEEFYIRNGPSSAKLAGSELINYSERRFRRDN